MTTRDSVLLANCFQSMFDDETIKTITAFCPRTNRAKHRVRVTRNRRRSTDFHVAIGSPNYGERQFLKLCRKAKAQPKHSLIKRFK